MGFSMGRWRKPPVEISTRELTGALGDSITVLPVLVALAALTDHSVPLMFVWFGLFQIVWGLYYGVPISVEPMKALAALLLARSIDTTELLVAGLLLGLLLLLIGKTRSLDRVNQYIGAPVVRGVQFGVALILLETGVEVSRLDPSLAGLAAVVMLITVAAGYWRSSAIVVVLLGAGIATVQVGLPSPSLPSLPRQSLTEIRTVTVPTVRATVGQLAMTVGNAALATSALLSDYFDRDISADDLAVSMGAMNLVAVPFGGLPMCHGSGGVAGKYAFGARTAGANVILGIGYVLVAFLATRLVEAYPLSVLGVVLLIIGLQIGRTSLEDGRSLHLVLGIGFLSVAVNLGVAFGLGIAAYRLEQQWRTG